MVKSGFASEHLDNAKEILEKINQTDSDLYKLVLSNIYYVKNLNIKNIIKDMAKSMIEESDFYQGNTANINGDNENTEDE